MDVVPIISILVFIFSMIIVKEIMDMKREIRKLKRVLNRKAKNFDHIKQKIKSK